MSDLVSQLVGALERLSGQCERMRLPGQPMSDAEKNAIAALTAAKAGGWMDIEQAPRDPVCQDGNNHYSEYILAWWPTAMAPTRCRWWFRDDSNASAFIADGGYAVYPTVFQPLPAPPAQKDNT